jgi:hypothetical protein
MASIGFLLTDIIPHTNRHAAITRTTYRFLSENEINFSTIMAA